MTIYRNNFREAFWLVQKVWNIAYSIVTCSKRMLVMLLLHRYQRFYRHFYLRITWDHESQLSFFRHSISRDIGVSCRNCVCTNKTGWDKKKKGRESPIERRKEGELIEDSARPWAFKVLKNHLAHGLKAVDDWFWEFEVDTDGFL